MSDASCYGMRVFSSGDSMTDLVLHNYFRSSTSVRVRVALNLKGLEYHYAAYPLLDKAHKTEAYLHINPQGLVPALQLSPDKTLTQSLAIIEYLDETVPLPPLLPVDPLERARVRSLAQVIACEIHPVNNLRVLQHLRAEFSADDAQVKAWFKHWVTISFDALEQRLTSENETGVFCHGDVPGLADICLYAQVLNNQRFDVEMENYATIQRIFNQCEKLDAFERAHPARQPDAL